MQRLATHAWPGNVRELRNTMKDAAAVVVGDTLEDLDLRLEAPRLAAPPPDAAGPNRDQAPAPAEFRPITEELSELEARRMSEALAACGGVHTRAAALIGMPIRTFTNKVKLYGLSARDAKKPP